MCDLYITTTKAFVAALRKQPLFLFPLWPFRVVVFLLFSAILIFVIFYFKLLIIIYIYISALLTYTSRILMWLIIPTVFFIWPVPSALLFTVSFDGTMSAATSLHQWTEERDNRKENIVMLKPLQEKIMKSSYKSMFQKTINYHFK